MNLRKRINILEKENEALREENKELIEETRLLSAYNKQLAENYKTVMGRRNGEMKKYKVYGLESTMEYDIKAVGFGYVDSLSYSDVIDGLVATRTRNGIKLRYAIEGMDGYRSGLEGRLVFVNNNEEVVLVPNERVSIELVQND